MTRVIVLLSLASALLCQAAWRATPIAARGAQAPAAAAARYVDRTRLMRDVLTLASAPFEGRRAGTAGGLKARAWLVDQFASIGLTPARGNGYMQPFTFAAREGRAVLPGGGVRTVYPAANVVGRIAGREPGIIVVTAHYDHLGIRDGVLYPGADDNASGIAVLLAAARHFTTTAPRHTLVFAALDAEEAGLHGARALLRSGVLPRGRVRLNINLDMVSRSAANEIYAAGPFHAPWETAILEDIQTRASVAIRFGHDRPSRQDGGREDWTHSSDHGPFHDAGVPFVYFGVEDHAAYHKPADSPDTIDPGFFGDAADMIVEAIRTFDARLPSPESVLR
ncbi:MAG: M20/M25/M40 family metallo-hydrolase [Acidobacteria bacterium]|nr:M20/M25/M40 family metallo-hydrolase [Acidobacteriota bacterium]